MAKYDIFISYARKDFDEVNAFKKLLEARLSGVRIWFDLTGVESGEQFINKIVSAINNSDIIIMFVSDNFINSKWAQKEVLYAWKHHKHLVPILLKDAKIYDWLEFLLINIDTIDSRDNRQTEKLIGNLSSWLNITSKNTLSIIQPQQESPSTLEFNVKGVNFKMIKVEGGTFVMGHSEDEEFDGYDDNRPAHQVTLSDYYFGQNKVTQQLWEAVMSDNPSMHKEATSPVENVSWKDVQNFLRRLNKLTGKKFNLPTEAQWEYAARGGKDGHFSIKRLENLRRYHPNELSNELGFYELFEKVGEWCSDWYGEYSQDKQLDPQGPVSGERRVFRGTTYDNSIVERSCVVPSNRDDSIGFRLALSL